MESMYIWGSSLAFPSHLFFSLGVSVTPTADTLCLLHLGWGEKRDTSK